MLQDESTLTFNNRINQKRSAPPELFNDEQLLCFALSSDALNHQILNQNDPLRRRIRVLHLYVFIRINLKKKKKKKKKDVLILTMFPEAVRFVVRIIKEEQTVISYRQAFMSPL